MQRVTAKNVIERLRSRCVSLHCRMCTLATTAVKIAKGYSVALNAGTIICNAKGLEMETNAEEYLRQAQIDANNAHNNAHQIGGNHYKNKAIQPWDYIVANDMGYLAGNIIKYVTRYKDKNGVEDLKKARHYLDKLIEVTVK